MESIALPFFTYSRQLTGIEKLKNNFEVHSLKKILIEPKAP